MFKESKERRWNDLREDIDFTEHGKAELVDDGLTFHTLFHLGTVKGCPLCKDIQRRNLSQIREYRFSINSGLLYRVVAICFAYDEGKTPLWDLTGYRSKLFAQVYPLEKQDQVANTFLEIVHSEFGGEPGTIRRGSDVELTQYENDYLRNQREKPKD